MSHLSKDADLSAYHPAAQQAIRSEAEAWRYGDVESARRTYDENVTWARRLTPALRRKHRADAWHANELLRYTALDLVQREFGEPTA